MSFIKVFDKGNLWTTNTNDPFAFANYYNDFLLNEKSFYVIVFFFGRFENKNTIELQDFKPLGTTFEIFDEDKILYRHLLKEKITKNFTSSTSIIGNISINHLENNVFDGQISFKNNCTREYSLSGYLKRASSSFLYQNDFITKTEKTKKQRNIVIISIVIIGVLAAVIVPLCILIWVNRSKSNESNIKEINEALIVDFNSF